jgi:hypothetical protein
MKTTLKLLGLTIASLLLSSNLISQWGGSTATTGLINRSGNVNITESIPGTLPISPPNDYQLYVFSHSKKFGIKAVCNGTRQHGISTETNNNNTIAFSVRNNYPVGCTFCPAPTAPIVFTPTNEETFVVLGSGHVYATEITVKNFPVFPDYVFNENYDLLSLYEIEQYINKYNHLPNIPSAKEVADKGLSLGDMQVKQMEKIEELTLHLIEMKKENDALKNQNDSLKSDIEKIKDHLKID